MTLRWRLALALAVLAGLATAATAAIAYRSTRSQLYAEVDRFLTSRAPQVDGPGGRGTLVDRLQHGPRGDGLGRGPDVGGWWDGGPGPGSVALGGPFPQLDTEVQVLDQQGDVVARSGTVQVPVDEADRAIAADGGPARLHTVRVADVPYRVRTVGYAGGGAVQVARDTSETERVLSALRWRSVAVGLAVVAGAAVVGWIVARRTTSPLLQLTDAAERVATTGDLATAIRTTGSDETGRLARAFATMLGALGRSRQQQQQLVQDASHELRTPLTSLRTNIEVLDRHPDLRPEARQAVFNDLRSELAELGDLVTELVQLAADQRDDEAPTTFALGDIAARTAARAGRRHGRAVVVTGAGAVVAGQRAALERALANLVDNAAKFSPPGSPIEVALEGRRVSVRDHGPGIDPADRGRVFDRFYRAGAARQLPGSGLGLAIVRQVVEAHGGTVFATDHPDGGAVVGFELPGSPPDEARRSATPAG
jgi:two-component system sensor histidine kinase MprB